MNHPFVKKFRHLVFNIGTSSKKQNERKDTRFGLDYQWILFSVFEIKMKNGKQTAKLSFHFHILNPCIFPSIRFLHQKRKRKSIIFRFLMICSNI